MAVELSYKQNIQREPVNYSGEFWKFQELRLNEQVLTTTGTQTFTSPSSNITYISVSGGEKDLMSKLETVLINYISYADEFNKIVDFFKQLDYQTVTVVGTQIRCIKNTSLNTLNIYIPDEINGLISISFNNGVTSKPVKDYFGVQYSYLTSGYYQLSETANSMVIASNVTKIENVLTSDDEKSALSANKGKELKTSIDLMNRIITTTIPSSWVGSAPPYTQVINVSGINNSDSPIISPVYSSTTSIAQAQKIAWNNIDNIITGTNTLTCYCFNEKPITTVPIQIKGV